MKAVFGSI